MGMKVHEFVNLLEGVGPTDAIVRAVGLFPNEESARKYEDERASEGFTGEACRHAFAEYPYFLSGGGGEGKKGG